VLINSPYAIHTQLLSLLYVKCITFIYAKAEVVIGADCLSLFCVQDYCKSNQPTSLKLGDMIGPINWKN